MQSIRYVKKEDEENKRIRYIQGCYFPSMFKIMEMELCPTSSKKYPIPIKCNFEEFIYNNEQRLQWRLVEFSDWRYDTGQDWALCYIVQEIPMYYPTVPGKYIQERIYQHDILVGGIYCDTWAKEGEGNDSCEWTACEGEDELIAHKFSELHICKKGEIVQIVKDNSLTIGIVIEYCNDGSYDMWVWNDNQKCSKERIPVSRVLYDLFYVYEADTTNEEIKEELKKKLL